MNVFLTILLVAGASAARLLPHPANLTPVGALALFLGARLGWRRGAFATLAAMLISDAVIGFYDWRLMAAVYGSLSLGVIIGEFVGKDPAWMRLFAGAASGSIFFFAATNFAVWVLSPWYPHTLAGLAECYTAAIPFFRNTLAGDVFWSSVLFGAYGLFARPWTRGRTAPVS